MAEQLDRANSRWEGTFAFGLKVFSIINLDIVPWGLYNAPAKKGKCGGVGPGKHAARISQSLGGMPNVLHQPIPLAKRSPKLGRQRLPNTRVLGIWRLFAVEAEG